MIRILLLVVILFFGYVYLIEPRREPETVVVSEPPVVQAVDQPRTAGQILDDNLPPTPTPTPELIRVTVVHGDILGDGRCHLRVYPDGQAPSSFPGLTGRSTITAPDQQSLDRQIEDLRAIVARRDPQGVCPDG